MINKIINLSIYLLRYFSIINTKYIVSDKINFGSSLANNYFKKNLKNSKFYLEFGAGNSTFLAKKLKKKFISIETDKSFYKFIKSKKINNIFFSNIGPTKYYSNPILPTFLLKNFTEKYANNIIKVHKKFNLIPDLILIDGRFRVYVTLKILIYYQKNFKNKNIKIILDDYKNRKQYHILKKLVDIKSVGRFGVIILNDNNIIKSNKIEKYLSKFILEYL